MAERAHTAKEAIDIAIKLLGEYGYFSEGRTYTVADKTKPGRSPFTRATPGWRAAFRTMKSSTSRTTS